MAPFIRLGSKTLQRRRLLIFAFGGILGPIGDACHVWSGTLAYPPSPWLVPQLPFPLWVPPLFGMAALGLAQTNVATELVFESSQSTQRSPRPAPTTASVSAGVLSFLLLYAASGFLPLATGGARDIILALGAIAIWWRFDASRSGLIAGAIGAVFGTLFESLISARGFFAYLPGNTNLLSVPSWLPWLYLAASVATAQFARFLARRTRAPA